MKMKNEMNIQMWAARDLNGDLFAFEHRPKRDHDVYVWEQSGCGDSIIALDNDMLPDLCYDDEPIRINVSLKIDVI